MVGISLVGVERITHVHEALVHAVIVVDTVGAWKY